MAASGFPTDDYTPHGYLANPYAVAHSWTEGEGGCLRTSREHVGMGWQLPWALKAQASVDLIVTLEGNGKRLVTRADFDAASLTSPHHSANLFVYRWQAFGRVWEAAYTLSEPQLLLETGALGLQVSWESLPDSSDRPDVTLTIELVGRRADRNVTTDAYDRVIDLGAPFGQYKLLVDEDDQPIVTLGTHRVSAAYQVPADDIAGSRAVLANEAPGEARQLRNTPPPVGVTPTPNIVSDPVTIRDTVELDVGQARRGDDAFWNGAARLEGDWPDSWRRGWVYDTETTRMCVFPPGGIFTDVWPAWMIQWPRAVIAENTLDMARLAYASPDLAQRALLSLFRDAEAPNVPCVFQHGEPNMVAQDGSICGTSPAWCVPFYNLERLFSFTLDRAWLAQIYPYLKRYVEWWLTERTDADGWAVYTCTWEAGEDDTPRLDPERRGDNVVSAFVRPVELQATMALSAGVLARFAAALGEAADQQRWRTVEAAYLDRTQQLWDATEGRFRDWDARNGRFLAAAATNEPNYWGIDPCRFSALAFTPLLAGLTDDEYRTGLRQELRHYAGPPWTLWASWSYVVLEAARFAGHDDADAPGSGRPGFAADVSAHIVGRVYDELDARQIAAPSHPTPGVAREYWPLDLDTWASCEGYGWGANTASLLVRQVFGFLEGPYLDESGTSLSASTLIFELRPGLPDHLLIPGREYWLSNLPYRGARLSVGYRVADAPPDADGRRSALTILVSADGADRREIPSVNGAAYVVELEREQ